MFKFCAQIGVCWYYSNGTFATKAEAGAAAGLWLAAQDTSEVVSMCIDAIGDERGMTYLSDDTAHMPMPAPCLADSDDFD